MSLSVAKRKTYYKGFLYFVICPYAVLLAATAQNRCTSLVCSCYAPSKGFNNKGEESINNTTIINTKKLSPAEKKDGLLEEVDSDDRKVEKQAFDTANNGRSKNNDSTRSGSYVPRKISDQPFNLKSNLKKTVVKDNLPVAAKTEKRKVTWPDAHGKDIAHVQEFETSVSEDGELEGVRNSCVCVIQ